MVVSRLFEWARAIGVSRDDESLSGTTRFRQPTAAGGATCRALDLSLITWLHHRVEAATIDWLDAIELVIVLPLLAGRTGN